MSHIVICKCCGEKFDRDTEPFAQVGSRRYAHAKCVPTGTAIIDPHNTVLCKYCGKEMDIKTAVKITTGCYAHAECISELTDSEKLDQYIMQIYETNYVPPGIKKQINQFVKDYRFSYTGILKSLKYFYEVQKKPFDKKMQSIGIVPYVYQNAYNYYYTLWLASQQDKTAIKKPTVVNITINRPKRKEMKSKLFTFLEEE